MDTRAVLIAEDDPGISHMMRLVLEEEGFSVAIARDGEETLRLVESLTPGVVLLDLRLPILSGEEVISRLRATQTGSRPKILLTSASAKLKEIAAEMGADGFVAKPFDIDDLVAATHKAFDSRSGPPEP
jgi:DNA-binding response OmpR family regulator